MIKKLSLFVIAIFFVQCKNHQTGSGVGLESAYWKLVEVNGTPVKIPEEDREAYMILTRENNSRNLKGHAGCNSMGGSYTVDGHKIKFQVLTTRMFCDAKMEVEDLFTRMLTATDTYRIKGDTLELYAGPDLLGKFESVPVK